MTGAWLRGLGRVEYIGRMSFASFQFLSPCRLLLVAILGAGCGEGDTSRRVAQAFQAGAPTPDEVPRMLDTELPFRYPAALYARKVQGNVTLRLHIDGDGHVDDDSTRIEESSGYPALDSAAIRGSHELHFIPAKLRGEPMPVTILFPVYFRHPEARALPGDTILHRGGAVTGSPR